MPIYSPERIYIMLGIYIHIPFCKSKCGYCDFCSTTKYDDKMMDGYMKTLITQIEEFFEDSNQKADTVYFGGGTPSVFGAKRIGKVLKELRKYVEIHPNAEITVEANPESCDKAFCKELKKHGVNRLSLGVQSAVDSELFTIGRIHTFKQAQEAVKIAKEYLTENISLDLIYGLPDQTMESWDESLQSIIDLAPAHISAYGLRLEEGSKMYHMNLILPDDDMQADMYLYAVEKLKNAGYDQYEVSNFAKNGMISRHNSKYWDLTEYLGLGAAAHSLYGGRRFGYSGNINNYINGIIELSESEDMAIEKKYRKGEYIMLMLRTTRGINEAEFYSIFGEDFKEYGKKLEIFIKNGYAEYDGMTYRLTPKGFLISNTIINELI